MRRTFRLTKSLAVCGLLVATVTSAGCQSGWKMPGASMFSWKKKPSEETLAGKGPTVSTPTSPALGQSPSLVANSARTPAAKPNTYAPPKTGSALGASALAATAPNAGLATPPTGMGNAATANGYTTGPYSTYAQPSNPYATAGTTYGATAAGGHAQPGGPATSPARASHPTGLASSYPATTSGPSAPPSVPAMAASYGQPPAGAPQTPSSLYSLPTGPANAPSTQSGLSSAGAYPAVPTNVASMAPSTTNYSPVGANAPSSISGGAGPSASFPSSSTVQASTASFRPGSTQRVTGYDFSGAAPASTPATSTPANTATGTSNPGYQLPPSNFYNR
jgi:hypothetical protein